MKFFSEISSARPDVRREKRTCCVNHEWSTSLRRSQRHWTSSRHGGALENDWRAFFGSAIWSSGCLRTRATVASWFAHLRDSLGRDISGWSVESMPWDWCLAIVLRIFAFCFGSHDVTDPVSTRWRPSSVRFVSVWRLRAAHTSSDCRRKMRHIRHFVSLFARRLGSTRNWLAVNKHTLGLVPGNCFVDSELGLLPGAEG